MLPLTVHFSPVTFSKSEIDFLTLLSSGYTDSEIAIVLNFSPTYIKTIVKRLVKKYRVVNRCHLVAFFVNSYYLTDD